MPAWLGAMFFKALLDWVAKKIGDLISLYRKKLQSKKEAEANAAVDTEKLTKIIPDSSKEDTDAAIDEASKRF
jgi:hypothetical protein